MQNKKHKCALYEIKNKINGIKYIGSSCNIKHRLWEHKNKLMKNEHHNKHLQNSVNLYGLSEFEFNILAYIEKDFQFRQKIL